MIQLGEFVFCSESIVPVRSEHKDQAEISTQLLFGEVAVVTDKYNQWVKVKNAHDQYEGWIDHKQVISISKESFENILKSHERQQERHAIIKSPWGLIHTVMGSFIPRTKIPFIVGVHTFCLVSSDSTNTPKDISNIAMSYKNAPYLWGGRTHYGIDCSGFIQAVYRFFEIELPRDASQQATIGEDVFFKDITKGDIVFFQNDKKSITHVGIVLENLLFIHASGRVRIDRLTPTGIFNDEIKKETHEIHSIKRILT